MSLYELLDGGWTCGHADVMKESDTLASVLSHVESVWFVWKCIVALNMEDKPADARTT